MHRKPPFWYSDVFGFPWSPFSCHVKAFVTSSCEPWRIKVYLSLHGYVCDCCNPIITTAGPRCYPWLSLLSLLFCVPMLRLGLNYRSAFPTVTSLIQHRAVVHGPDTGAHEPLNVRLFFSVPNHIISDRILRSSSLPTAQSRCLLMMGFLTLKRTLDCESVDHSVVRRH